VRPTKFSVNLLRKRKKVVKHCLQPCKSIQVGMGWMHNKAAYPPRDSFTSSFYIHFATNLQTSVTSFFLLSKAFLRSPWGYCRFLINEVYAPDSTDDMLREMETLGLVIPEACRRAFTDASPVDSRCPVAQASSDDATTTPSEVLKFVKKQFIVSHSKLWG